MMIANSQPLSERTALYVRLSVGLVIGLIVAFLIGDDNKKLAESILPEDWREILAQTLTLVAFILWAGAAVMRRVSLAIWSALAGAVLLFILWHVRIYSGDSNASELQSILILLALTFIGNESASSADQAGKPFRDGLRQALRRGKPKPLRGSQLREAKLSEGRHIREGGQALRR
jgi:hypothetical protein